MGEVSDFRARYGSIKSGFFDTDEHLMDIEFAEMVQIGKSKVFYGDEAMTGVERIPTVTAILQDNKYFIVVLRNT